MREGYSLLRSPILSTLISLAGDEGIEPYDCEFKAHGYTTLLIPNNSITWHSLKDSNLGMSESKSDALTSLAKRVQHCILKHTTWMNPV